MSDINNGAMTGTDRINHAVAIAAAKRVMPHAASGISSVSDNRPLFGLGESSAEIIRASGLGRSAPSKMSRGEQMSDADQPTQDVKVKGGQAVHRKRNANGGVRETPLAGYNGELAEAVLTAPWYNAGPRPSKHVKGPEKPRLRGVIGPDGTMSVRTPASKHVKPDPTPPFEGLGY